MFKNNSNPPHPKKADDATMNVISWNHDFPSHNPF